MATYSSIYCEWELVYVFPELDSGLAGVEKIGVSRASLCPAFPFLRDPAEATLRRGDGQRRELAKGQVPTLNLATRPLSRLVCVCKAQRPRAVPRLISVPASPPQKFAFVMSHVKAAYITI